MLGRKTSLLEDASQVLKDFQAVSEVEPARDRAKSFSRQASSIIVFSSVFCHIKERKANSTQSVEPVTQSWESIP